jgi:putative addiction module component (TIGR02574 family)
MTSRAEALLSQALALGESERLAIAERLLETVPAADATADNALEAELRRRAAELRDDPSAGIGWDHLRAD